MKYDPHHHHRQSIRLKEYDYSQAGAYFITICTQGLRCLFGNVGDSERVMNDAGRMVQLVWNEMPDSYPGVETDDFIVMPNHIHGIIVLVGAAPRGRPKLAQPTDSGQSAVLGQPQGVAPTLSVSDVVHRFKTLTTKRYVDGVKQFGWVPFPGRLWQRNFYDHVIRNDESLNSIRRYIIDNPTQWHSDHNNPGA